MKNNFIHYNELEVFFEVSADVCQSEQTALFQIHSNGTSFQIIFDYSYGSIEVKIYSAKGLICEYIFDNINRMYFDKDKQGDYLIIEAILGQANLVKILIKNKPIYTKIISIQAFNN